MDRITIVKIDFEQINGTMAFSFGATTPAPAFGAPAPGAKPAFGAAPAPAPGGLFGSSAPAPGGLFGSTTPAPAPGGLFGSTTPAPAPGGFFGSTTPASAPGGLFGSSAPAPASGGLFGATAPAPAGGSLFGAPAPASGGLFGSTPAPAPGGLFGAPASAPGGLFGAPAPSAFGAAPAAVAPAANLAGYMPYSSLPQDQKNNLDTVHQAIMNHKRTILAVSTMAPKLLDTSTQQADVAGGGQEVPLSVTVQRLNGQVQQLESQLKSLHGSMMHTKQMYETSTTQAFRDAKWPTEFVATRVGVTLINNNQSNNNNAKPANPAQSSSQDKKNAEEVNRRLQELLDREMTHTDQIYRMPSPYLWQCVEEMEGRSRTLQGQLQSLKDTLDIANQVSAEEFDVMRILQLQEQTIWKVAADLTRVHARVDELRQLYNLHEKGINVVEEARHKEEQYQRQRDQEVRSLMVKTLPTTLPASGAAPAAGTSLFGTPSTGTSLFGKSPAPAPGTSLFGAPAPAPGGSLFGTPAPAPSGGLFGSTPAPAPSGGLFGSTAPAPSGGLFGSTPAPAFGAAPAPAAPAFGAAPAPAFGAAPAPATGGLFGSAPAPAPGGGLFGAAPAPGGLFGSTTATPKSKSKRNSSRRR